MTSLSVTSSVLTGPHEALMSSYFTAIYLMPAV